MWTFKLFLLIKSRTSKVSLHLILIWFFQENTVNISFIGKIFRQLPILELLANKPQTKLSSKLYLYRDSISRKENQDTYWLPSSNIFFDKSEYCVTLIQRKAVQDVSQQHKWCGRSTDTCKWGANQWRASDTGNKLKKNYVDQSHYKAIIK